MSSDLLFELGTEELPSGAVWSLADALASNMVATLGKAGLRHGEVRQFATPRRLAVWIRDVQEKQPNQNISRRGPACVAAYDADGKPTDALLGFARSCGVSLEALTTVKSDKGEWLVYESSSPGADTRDLLPDMVNEVISALPMVKPMRWGEGDAEFARPVHWAVLLFGDKVISADVLGIKTGRQSYGHRFHHPQAVDISSPHLYEVLLKDAFVIADFNVRRQMIVDQVTQLAEQHGFQAIMPESLVDEVTSIVEWPQALLANFEQEFLDVPAEALIAAMQSHQKCFALRDSRGQLQSHFIAVANIASHYPEQVIAGNEKVMRARLSDAAFFYRQDQKRALSEHIPATANVIFQARLGSLQDKAMRIQALMNFLIHPLQLNEKQAWRAAELCKCDLMTGMVGEFPELQGLMGYYYARHDGEDDRVAQALNEQYRPRFAADVLPKTDLGLALSLADRLDTLVGIFAIGQKPTGVKDPFKLRRHALAVVRLLMATSAPLNLSTLIEQALHGYKDRLSPANEVVVELRTFILERMQSFYQSQGIASELVLAVRARQDNWLYDVDKRVKALLNFIHLPEAIRLSAACKRVNNILQQASFAPNDTAVEPQRLEESAERSLFDHIQTMEQVVAPLYSEGNYARLLEQLASLREPVDAFFDHVMVMVDDDAVKMNRLRLLSRLQALLQGVADISLLSV
ncbi:glycine--tRNA ligase subunit beta [Legionella nagasakiensis]|uniref:glycine--tRNA ligase subunit beta n=1 Tax=Legionella nagasakiensis TaxID=535290 RepID=UPI001054D64A|nr:glycine--tRNA ligase subunit beta [Legionella nagasakiensis]